MEEEIHITRPLEIVSNSTSTPTPPIEVVGTSTTNAIVTATPIAVETTTLTFTPYPCHTPEGSKEWIPRCPPEKKPTVGMLFDSLADGIKFYTHYARLCGFVERLGTEKKDKDGSVNLKYVYCNKQGFKEDGDSKAKLAMKNEGKCTTSFNSQKRSINRGGCEAKIAMKKCNDGKFKVYLFHESHNHLFATPKSMHFLKNSRKLTLYHKRFIFNNSKLNIGPNKSYRLMKEHVGGYENVGASIVDFKNFSRDIKAYLRDVDAAMFINNLKEKVKNSGGGFFFDHCLDEGRHLTRVFWADAISRKNYALFGDMVSFDTTFDTNTYSMIFAPFTGLDHHGKCVTFGIGLLANEDIESFVWLFECFMRAMGNCQPTCIMTDQDPAMKVAIERVFDKAKHRLCMWHIMKKVSKKVGPSMCADTDFLKKLNDVVWDRDLEIEEFEARWKAVMLEFGLENHSWFVDMYGMRDMWIPSYFRDLFLGGILRSTQISECENNFFTYFTNPHCLLVELWFRIESAMDAQRHTQAKLNSESKNTMPRLVTPLHLEKHASLVYTHRMFYKFQHEFQHAVFNCGMSNYRVNEGVEEYQILDNTRKRTYEVRYTVDSYESGCSCKMFESMGLLCRHILYVMKMKFLQDIPKSYVLHRWTKDALKKPILDMWGDLDSTRKDDKLKLVGDLWSKFFSCMSLAEDSEDLLQSLLDRLNIFETDIECGNSSDKQESKDKHIELLVGSNEIEVDILPPNKSSNKGSGSGKRKKSDQEIATEERKKERLCRTCGQLSTHDSRNCPQKGKNKE